MFLKVVRMLGLQAKSSGQAVQIILSKTALTDSSVLSILTLASGWCSHEDTEPNAPHRTIVATLTYHLIDSTKEVSLYSTAEKQNTHGKYNGLTSLPA